MSLIFIQNESYLCCVTKSNETHKSYLLSWKAFNVAAAGLMTVGSRVAQDPMIIKLAAAALNAVQLNR